jgi:Spy/CpxP family protein refolding chaperone
MAFLTTALMLVSAQHDKSPYAGQEQRAIKALSEGEIEAYLSGAGMGLAKAAELNGFPGPKHVLELAAELGLTDRQKQTTQQIYDRMHNDAVRLGKLIVAKERELNDSFAQNQINAGKLDAITSDIARLQAGLRAAHLRAHLEMKRVLTVEQTMKYNKLRGYDEGEAHSQHHTGRS